MYESPIEIMYGEMKMQVVDNVVKAVQEQQIHVDREELIKALRGERNQYQKGFNDAAKEIFAEIKQGLEELSNTHRENSNYSGVVHTIQARGIVINLKNKYIGGVGE